MPYLEKMHYMIWMEHFFAFDQVQALHLSTVVGWYFIYNTMSASIRGLEKMSVRNENTWGKTPTPTKLIKACLTQWYPTIPMKGRVVWKQIHVLSTCLGMSTDYRLCWYEFLQIIAIGSSRGKLIYSYCLHNFLSDRWELWTWRAWPEYKFRDIWPKRAGSISSHLWGSCEHQWSERSQP